MDIYQKAAINVFENKNSYMCNAIDDLQIIYKDRIAAISKLQDMFNDWQWYYGFNSGRQYENLYNEGYDAKEVRILTLLFMSEITKKEKK